MNQKQSPTSGGFGGEADPDTLALEGGVPVRSEPLPPCLPGGMAIGEEEKAEVLQVLDTKSLYRNQGPNVLGKVQDFERAFARRVGKKHALAVSSGTAALRVGLAALGVGPGDEVIVPAVTFLATVGATVMARAIPVFAEIDKSVGLDPEDFEAKITSRTKAVIPVHIQGVPCRIDAIMDVAKRHGVKVLEDCAQSCGATYQGRSIGSFGDLNAFSLQYAKVITSGEGGVLVTDDDDLFERAVRAHDHGVVRPPSGQILGVYQEQAFLAENYRMGELAGAVAGAQLRKLDGLLATLRALKKRIKDAISDIEEFEFRPIPAADEEVGFTLVFYLAERDKALRFVEALVAENVDAYQLYDGDPVYAYPQVLNQRTPTDEGCPFKCPLAARRIEYEMGMCPKTEELMGRSVWIPISTLLTDGDADDIIKAIRKVNRALA